MNNTKLIIKGAHYFDGEQILIAHFTGEFIAVDCDRFIAESELNERYDESYIKENIENYIEYAGVNYYYAEYSCFNVGDWDLLSDLSKLEHTEENYY